MRRNIFKRILCLVLTISAVVSIAFSLSSCDRSYDEKEVLTAAEELLRNAEVLNEVYYGDGIATRSEGHRNGYYLEADAIHLSYLGFETIEELRNLTRATFTKGYCEQIFDTKLDSISDEAGILKMARYYQYYDEDTLAPVCIMVYTRPTVTFKDKLVYDYTTLRVSGVKRDTVFVTVTATITNSEGQSQSSDIVLYLIEESDGWRIDSPCYANYNAYKDRYDDLNK